MPAMRASRSPRVLTRTTIALGWLVTIFVAHGCSDLDVGIDRPDAAADASPDSDSDSGDASSCIVPTGAWQGCAPSGCLVCPDRVAAFPLYLKNHAYCALSADCRGAHAACSGDCPAPAATDQCDGTPGVWAGCRGNGCWVCTELVVDYPNYFAHHPNCIANAQCNSSYFTCSAACATPTAADR